MNITIDELKARLESRINSFYAINNEFENTSSYFFKHPERFGNALFYYKLRELNKELLYLISKDGLDTSETNKILNDVYRKYYSSLKGITIV